MAIKQLNAMMSVNPNQANCGTAPAFTVTVAVTLEADSVGGAYAVYIYDHENFPWFDVLLEEKLNIAYPDGPAFNFQQHPLTLDCTANCFSRVPGSGVRGRGSGERETTASSLAGKEESSRKEDNSGQGKDGPAGAIAQGGNGR